MQHLAINTVWRGKKKSGSYAGGQVGRDSLGLSAPAASAVPYVTTQVYWAIRELRFWRELTAHAVETLRSPPGLAAMGSINGVFIAYVTLQVANPLEAEMKAQQSMLRLDQHYTLLHLLTHFVYPLPRQSFPVFISVAVTAKGHTEQRWGFPRPSRKGCLLL